MSPSVTMVTGMLGLDGLTGGIKIYRMVDGFILYRYPVLSANMGFESSKTIQESMY